MASSSAGLVAGQYSIDVARPLPGAAPPSLAYAAAAGSQGGFMALPVARGFPARARALSALAGCAPGHLLTPLAHGPGLAASGEAGYFVICAQPPGPSLAASMRAWPEAELLDHVLKPAAAMLAELQARGVTHRAIRPDNVFQTAPGTAVTFGPAWSAPPACHQPAWLEPPYSAACDPCGRGDGTVADDVYALGALLIALSLGRNPLEDLADGAVIARKLEHGSYAALAGKHRLPAAISELARGMLAEDPDHRPSPALLATPAAARSRRIAARPIRRSQNPIEVAGEPAMTARMLALLLRRHPSPGLLAIRTGAVDRWLRRGLGDPLMAGQLDEAVRIRDSQVALGDPRADPLLLATAVAILDGSAPLVWRSVTLWPGGLGPAIDHALHHAPEQTAALAEVATTGIVPIWAARRDQGSDSAAAHLDARDLAGVERVQRNSNVAWWLTYRLNPLVPCESALVQRSWVTRLVDLLPAMEAALAGPSPPAATGKPGLLDPQAAMFIAARRDERFQGDIGNLAAGFAQTDLLAELRILAHLQQRLHPTALPCLCTWAATMLQGQIDAFSSRSRRVRLSATLAALAASGQLPPIAALLDDKAERAADRDGAAAARTRLDAIGDALAECNASADGREAVAQKLGQDIANGLGAIASLAAAAWALFL